MFGFVKQISVSAIIFFFGCNVSNVNSLKCVSMNNQECKIRPEIININSNEPSFYLYSTEINKCSGICNNINDPYSKQDIQNEMKLVNANVDQMQVFVITNNVRITINADVNLNN